MAAKGNIQTTIAPGIAQAGHADTEVHPFMPTSQLPATPPFWNVVSLLLPVAAILIGLIMLSSNHRSGDFAGALGAGVLFALGLAAVSVLGEIAAIIALCRGERFLWLSLLGVLINGAFFLPVLAILLRDN